MVVPRIGPGGQSAFPACAQFFSRLVGTLVTLSAVSILTPRTSHAELRITELLVNGTSSSDLDEWVELTNVGTSPLDLADYRIGDEELPLCESSCEGFFAFPTTTVAPGESIIFTRTVTAFNTAFAVPASVKRYQPQIAAETGPLIAVRDLAVVPNASGIFALNNNLGDEVLLLKKVSNAYVLVDGVSYLGSGATTYTPPGGSATRFMDTPIASIGIELQSIARISAGLDTNRASDWVLVTSPTPGTVPPPVCPNGLLEVGETCDDDNDLDGDGCAANCTVECGYSCLGAGPLSCAITCGDGDLGGAEECDDGNTSSGDGCDVNCTIELGYDCSEAGTCDGLDSVSTCILDPCALPLRISEVHLDGYSDPALEWIELTNAGPIAIDLSSWTITDQEFEGLGEEGALSFPPGAVIESGSSIVLAANGADFAEAFNLDASFEYLADSSADIPLLSLPNPWANDTTILLDNAEDELLLVCGGFVRDYAFWGPASVERAAVPGIDYGPAAPTAGPVTLERVETELHSGTFADWALSTCPTPFVAPNPNPPPDVRYALVTTAQNAVTFRLPVDDPSAVVTLLTDGLLGTAVLLDPNGLVRYTPPATPASLSTGFDFIAKDACSTVGPGRVDIEVAPPTCDPGQANLLLSEIHIESRDEPTGEWVEVINPSDTAVDLGLLRVGDFAASPEAPGLVAFPPATFLAPGETIVLAASADGFRNDWGFIPQLEWEHDTDGFPNETPHALFSGLGTTGIIRLDTLGDGVRLIGCDGTAIDEIYWGARTDNSNESPWARRLPAPRAWDGTTRDGPRTFERRHFDQNALDSWVSQSCPTPASPRLESAAPVAVDEAIPVPPGEVLEGRFSATDADSANLTFSGRAEAGDLTIVDPRTGDFTWTAPEDASGTYELAFEVSDGCHTDFGWVTVCIGGVEVPGNDIDEDCNGVLLCYEDRDGDGFGTSTTLIDVDQNGCQSPLESTRSDDCDDLPTACGASCHPGRTELCDNRDNDCNALTLDGSADPSVGTACDASADADLCNDDLRTCASGSLVCTNNAAGDASRTEVCDAFDVDEDCDGQADDLDTTPPANRTRFYPDVDNDGFGTGIGILLCNRPPNHATAGGDCSDGPGGCAGACYPGRNESLASGNCADGFDNDCDTLTDTDETCVADVRCYRDRDRDGFGDPSNQILLSGAAATAGCAAWLDGSNPAGSWVANGTDCADDPAGCGAACHPGRAEVCDGRDNDCNATTNDGSTDPEIGTACDSSADADACLDEVFVCASGVKTCPNVSSGDVARVETCDVANVDEDCDGGADDLDPQANATGRNTFYIDQDGDGRGRTSGTVLRCDLAVGFSTLSGDCDDSPTTCGANCRPGLVESGGSANCADTFDNDCDGFTDSDTECFGDVLCYLDRDRDGFGRFATETVVPNPGSAGCAGFNDGVNPVGSWVGNGLDCDDDPNLCGSGCYPGKLEICDGFDNDCLSTSTDGSLDPITNTTCDSTEDQDRCNDDRMVCRSGAMECANVSTNDLAQIEICDANRLDDDCDGGADDLDPDGSPATAPRWFADLDGDGYGNASTALKRCISPSGYASNGLDCDDSPADCGAGCHPGKDDVCDGLDNDCNDDTADGLNDPLVNLTCDSTDDLNRCNDDLAVCDDGIIICRDRPAGDSDRVEICDPLDIDEDCDGGADDDDPQEALGGTTFFADRDGDGHGDPSKSVVACDEGSGTAKVGDDCDDDTTSCGARCFPGRGETSAAGDCADGFDNDCDGNTDVGPMCVSGATCFADADKDGFGADSVSIDIAAGLVPEGGCGAWNDGRNPVGFWVARGGDCNDEENAIHPDMSEIVGNDIDENCNGTIRCWFDGDDDGYAREDALEEDAPSGQTCTEAVNLASRKGDCEDSPLNCGADCNPEALEICDNLDNDCDEIVDPGNTCDKTLVGVLGGGDGCAGGGLGTSLGALFGLGLLSLWRRCGRPASHPRDLHST